MDEPVIVKLAESPDVNCPEEMNEDFVMENEDGREKMMRVNETDWVFRMTELIDPDNVE
jgi:hypothetical protein